MKRRQRTLSSEVHLEGVGVHSGSPVQMVLQPAAPDTGIVFQRIDLSNRTEVPANAASVVDTTLATSIEKDGVRIGTIEHLVAAVAGLGVDNIRVLLNGPEVPILDGSSAPFVAAMCEIGFVEQVALRNVLVVREPVCIQEGNKTAKLLPSSDGALHVDFTVDFSHPLIGVQTWKGIVTPQVFTEDLASARTFGFLWDLEKLKAAGLARGASLDNAVVLDEGRVVNPEGLRFSDEFVRHKALDAVGDLALAGYPMAAKFIGIRSGHAMNQRLVEALMAEPSNFALVPVPGEVRVSEPAPMLSALGA